MECYSFKNIKNETIEKLEKEFEEIFGQVIHLRIFMKLNFNKIDPKSKIFCAAILEWKRVAQSDDNLDLNSLKDRMQRSMYVIFNKESENVEKI